MSRARARTPRRAKSTRAAGRAHLAGRALAGAAPVFAALGDETRLDLVLRLSSGGPMSITRLSEGSGVTRQAITKHLHVLSDAGLVRGARAGRDHVWQMETARLDEVRRWLDHIEGQWDEALGRLKASLEAE